MIGQPLRACFGISAAMARPRSPASKSAYGSQNRASARADSQARYTATHRAVSETLDIGEALTMRDQSAGGADAPATIARIAAP